MPENSPAPNLAERVTGSSVDPQYDKPYVDVNELRAEPVPHRYVNGGFTGTGARFSFYFPPAEKYQGRFFHNTYPLALSENVGPFPIPFDVAAGNIGFTIDSGAYYVQTNLGGADRNPLADPAIAAYRVNAAAAKYSRVVAAELFGEHRPYGYLFGGSGGSYQVEGAAENTSGVWDGFLPYVLGTPNASPSVFTVRMHALRVLRLRNKLPAILDAIDPGGSGDPYAGLDAEEGAALREATLFGFPPRGWWNHETLTGGYFAHVAHLVPQLDPTYVTDFWNEPGYLGADPSSSVQAARATAETSVVQVIRGFPMRIELTSVPSWDITYAHVVLTSGAAAGKSIPIAAVDGRTITFSISAPLDVLGVIQPGDQATIDNSWPLALQTYQRHQVPTADLYGWNQYRDASGEPKYPQRKILAGPVSVANTAGCIPAGNITAKTLVLQSLMDIDALAWQADWYRSRVQEALGERFPDNFALWFIDHAQHDDPQTPAAHARTVSFAGALQQGLRDLSAWVENGARPPDTAYEVVDSQVRVPAGAVDRGGIQPVVELSVNGGIRTDVAVGESVTFLASVEVPPGAGDVVAAEWDFDGLGTYSVTEKIDDPQPTLRLSTTHHYDASGTYFPVLRATSQRTGDIHTPYGRIQNIARVRVVVE